MLTFVEWLLFGAPTWPQFGPPFQNRFSKKVSVLRRQNAQKSGPKVTESPQNLPHLGTPKIYRKCIFGNFGGPKSTSKMGPSWAIFYAPRWPKLRAPILAPKSIFYDLGASLLGPNLGKASVTRWPHLKADRTLIFFENRLGEGAPS